MVRLVTSVCSAWGGDTEVAKQQSNPVDCGLSGGGGFVQR